MFYRLYYKWVVLPGWYFEDFDGNRRMSLFLRKHGASLQKAVEYKCQVLPPTHYRNVAPPPMGEPGCIYLDRGYLKNMPLQQPRYKTVEDGRLVWR